MCSYIFLSTSLSTSINNVFKRGENIIVPSPGVFQLYFRVVFSVRCSNSGNSVIRVFSTRTLHPPWNFNPKSAARQSLRLLRTHVHFVHTSPPCAPLPRQSPPSCSFSFYRRPDPARSPPSVSVPFSGREEVMCFSPSSAASHGGKAKEQYRRRKARNREGNGIAHFTDPHLTRSKNRKASHTRALPVFSLLLGSSPFSSLFPLLLFPLREFASSSVASRLRRACRCASLRVTLLLRHSGFLVLAPFAPQKASEPEIPVQI